jgi:hypothetical protein
LDFQFDTVPVNIDVGKRAGILLALLIAVLEDLPERCRDRPLDQIVGFKERLAQGIGSLRRRAWRPEPQRTILLVACEDPLTGSIAL